MEASRVIVSQATRDYYENPLLQNKKRQRQIRIANIIVCLKKHNNLVTTAQLYQSAGYISHVTPDKAKANGYAFINYLVKMEVLKKEPYKGQMKKWTILKNEQTKLKSVVEHIKVKVPDLDFLEKKAQEFYWKNRSDSLHTFIETLISEMESTINE